MRRLPLREECIVSIIVRKWKINRAMFTPFLSESDLCSPIFARVSISVRSLDHVSPSASHFEMHLENEPGEVVVNLSRW